MLLVKLIEPPCTERYARWCERSEFLKLREIPPTRSRYDFLLGHLRIDQMAVHISVFFVGLECANDRDFCSQLGIVGRIAMLAREDEFQPLRAEVVACKDLKAGFRFGGAVAGEVRAGVSRNCRQNLPRIKFSEEISGEIDHSRSIFRGFRPISEGSFFMRLYNKRGRK